jgi:hypothetical protein
VQKNAVFLDSCDSKYTKKIGVNLYIEMYRAYFKIVDRHSVTAYCFFAPTIVGQAETSIIVPAMFGCQPDDKINTKER